MIATKLGFVRRLLERAPLAMATSLKSLLLSAKQNLDQQQYENCIDLSNKAISASKKSYDAYLYAPPS